MLKKALPYAVLLATLGACSNGDGEDTPPRNIPGFGWVEGDGDSGDGDTVNEDLPPGTDDPSADSSINRYEAQNDEGNGYAQSISYDATTDKFTVDNLGFDAANVYSRDKKVASLGPFAVYENDDPYEDSLTGTPIEQLSHKAIYGVGPSGKTRFAIVRTGAYVDYGFGGFVYQRDGGVTLPTAGQAAYRGDYAGLRDFKNRGGMEYTSAKMNVDIDFEDFNNGNAVKGSIYNRRVYDLDGNDITKQITDALSKKQEVDVSALPVVTFDIGPGVMDKNGEITGTLHSDAPTKDGAVATFEKGNYYAVISGKKANEVVGVIVIESEDPRSEGVTARETGGFVLTR